MQAEAITSRSLIPRRYVVSTCLGLIVGLVAIIFSSEINPFGDTWQIPCWDRWQQFSRPQMLPLQCKALCLRAAMLICENGFLYFAVPVLAACGLARMDDLGKTSRSLRCFAQSGFITIGSVIFVSFLWGMLAGPSDSGVPPYFGYQLLEGINDSLFLIIMAWGSLIAPTFWLIVFVCLFLIPPKTRSEK